MVQYSVPAKDEDVYLSGRLINIDKSRHRVDRRVQDFILRDYGVLECPEMGVAVLVRGAQLQVNRPEKTLRLTERREGGTGTSFTIELSVENGVDYDAWASALQELSAVPLSSEFCIDAADVICRGRNAVVFGGVREADGARVVTRIVPRRTVTAMVSVVETRVVTRLKLVTPQQYPRSLVRCFDVLQTKNETHVVMERVAGGSLEALLEVRGRMPDADARHVFLQVLEAVSFLHSVGIVHGAVATRNILVEEAGAGALVNVKLIGFNAASVKLKDSSRHYFPRRHISEYVRTFHNDGLECLAPEVWRNQQPDPQMDFWALGCLLYKILVGPLPFSPATLSYWKASGDGEEQIADSYRHYARISRPDLRQRLLFPEDRDGIADLSPDARSLLFLLLTPDPTQRMSSATVLRHPWVFIPRCQTGSESTDYHSQG